MDAQVRFVEIYGEWSEKGYAERRLLGEREQEREEKGRGNSASSHSLPVPARLREEIHGL